MKAGDKVKLTGKTKHGKNRVREQGELWRVIKIKGALPHGRWPAGTEIAEIESLDGRHWRFISTIGDTDFDVQPK